MEQKISIKIIKIINNKTNLGKKKLKKLKNKFLKILIKKGTKSV